MTELLKNGFSAMKLSVSDAQIAQLEDFTARMLDTNKVMNLTRITDPKEIAEKHLLDCASLLQAADFSKKSVVDVGCGAGFPGMPLHILCPSCKLTLLDSLGKRIRFLQGCIDAMNLSDIEAVHARAEEFAAKHREQYDFAVSRAVAQLNVLAELSLPLVKQGGAFIAMKSTMPAATATTAVLFLRNSMNLSILSPFLVMGYFERSMPPSQPHLHPVPAP